MMGTGGNNETTREPTTEKHTVHIPHRVICRFQVTHTSSHTIHLTQLMSHNSSHTTAPGADFAWQAQYFDFLETAGARLDASGARLLSHGRVSI